MNVEPLSREHGRLCAARPADTNLRVALGATAGRGTLFVEPAEPRESPDPDAPIDRGASTMVLELAARYRTDGQEFTPIEVPIWTLAQVVADHVPGPVQQCLAVAATSEVIRQPGLQVRLDVIIDIVGEPPPHFEATDLDDH